MASGKTTGSGQYAESLLKLIFNATSYNRLARDDAPYPYTNLWVSLHTSSPGATGNQTTNEATYTSYARVMVARTTGGWTVALNQVYPVANISFPIATGGSETITYFGIGTDSTGTGNLLYWGQVTPSIAVSNGVTPILLGGASQSYVSES
jgi:hypothetical protein